MPVLEHQPVGDMKSPRCLCEPVPQLTGLPLSQAEKMDHLMSAPLLSDDDLKDSNGRVRTKDRGEQAYFSVSVQCLAQNDTENHNLPPSGSGFSWEYI